MESYSKPVSDNEIPLPPDNFSYTFRSISLLSTTINELSALNKNRNPDELAILNSKMFIYYHMSLRYCMTLEYCKLLEKPNKNGSKASLFKLNDVVAYLKKDEHARYEEIKKRLNAITSSEFFLSIRKIRDEEFAHTDKSENPNKFSIKAFTDAQLNTLIEHFNEIQSIHQTCADLYSIHYHDHQEDALESFLIQSVRHRKFYNENNKTPWV